METSTKIDNVYQAIKNLTYVVGQHIQNGGDCKGPKVVCTIEQFWHLKPSVFKGDTDPLVVESWIMQKQKIFDILGCAEEHKVPFTTFTFEGEAEHWW